jgi:hypothetical protein
MTQNPNLTMSKSQNTLNEYDSPWKEIIEQFFPEFMSFFFPDIDSEIDWNQPYEFLDNELEKITQDAEIGKRYADKLVKVFLIDGAETWLLVHIEIQGYKESDFGFRMFIYNRRIGEKHNKEVVSLAILCDPDPNYRPQQYQHNRWGCELSFKFPIIKLLDFEDQEQWIENARNIFSIVVTAHLKSIKIKQPEKRKTWKMKLVKALYKNGYDRAIIIALFRFIDWVIALPKGIDDEFSTELHQFEEQQQMRYVTSIERIAIKKTETSILLRQMKKKFGDLSNELESRITDADSEQLEQWSENVLTAETINEVFH